VVGVRDQELERLLAELRGERFRPYLPPTVSTPLGYLMPEQWYKTWTFETLESVPEQAKDMTEAIVAYGVPFMQQTSARDTLIATMRRRPANEMFFYRLPVALWLEGASEESCEVVANALARIGNRYDDEAQRYRRFADRFRQLVKE
jgi:hypothetical protein